MKTPVDHHGPRNVVPRVETPGTTQQGMDADSMQDMKARMEAREAGITVLDLAETKGGRIAYLIETPHSFPRFVVGLTDAKLETVRILMGCGEEVTARERFAKQAA